MVYYRYAHLHWHKLHSTLKRATSNRTLPWNSYQAHKIHINFDPNSIQWKIVWLPLILVSSWPITRNENGLPWANEVLLCRMQGAFLSGSSWFGLSHYCHLITMKSIKSVFSLLWMLCIDHHNSKASFLRFSIRNIYCDFARYYSSKSNLVRRKH